MPAICYSVVVRKIVVYNKKSKVKIFISKLSFLKEVADVKHWNILLILLIGLILALALITLVPGFLHEENTGETKISWQEYELTDIQTGNTFKINDFKGQVVLLESFAVWCPACIKQQNEIKKLHEETSDEVISISLDTDPNEDEDLVKEHTTKNDFNWRYAISPRDLTRELIDEFGIGIINAISVPIILICEDQSSKLLRSGLKTVDELKREIKKKC